MRLFKILLSSFLFPLFFHSFAAVYTVNNNADIVLPAPGIFRQAVDDMNVAFDANAIFNFSGTYTISLIAPPIVLNYTPTLSLGAFNISILNGVISGVGGIIKTGTGVLTLTGVNLYTGGTTIEEGVLSVSTNSNLGGTGNIIFGTAGANRSLRYGASFDTARDINLTGDGTLDTNGFNSTLSGQVSGVGGIIKTGTGVLTLTGNNNYQGGTQILSGALTTNSTGVSNQSVVTINTGATFTISDNKTIGGAIGAGTISISNRSLTFHSDFTSYPFLFQGAITGTGEIKKSGLSEQIILSNIPGPLTVDSGLLKVEGNISGLVNIKADATLLHKGIAQKTMTVSGTLGTKDFGTITANEHIIFQDSASFLVEINASGQSGQLLVNGHIDISPSQPLKIIVKPTIGNYRPLTTYVIAKANFIDHDRSVIVENSRTFQFSTIVTDNNEIVLRATKLTTFNDTSATNSKKPLFFQNSSVENMKNYMEHLNKNHLLNTTWSQVYDNIKHLSNDQSARSLKKYDPAAYLSLRDNSFQLQNLNATSILSNQILRRNMLSSVGVPRFKDILTKLNGFDATLAVNEADINRINKSLLTSQKSLSLSKYYAYLLNQVTSPFRQEFSQSSIWGQPSIQNASINHKNDDLKHHYTTMGFNLGADHWVANQTLWGGSIYYGFNNFNWQNRDESHTGQGHIRTMSATVYNTYLYKDFIIESALTGGQNIYKSTRHIYPTQFTDYALNQSHGSAIGWGDIKISYSFQSHSKIFEPFARLSYMVEKESEYDESDNHGLNIHVDDQTFQMLQAEMGFFVNTQYKTQMCELDPHFKLSITHKMPTQNSRQMTAGFVGAPGGFVAKKNKDNQTFINLGVGVGAYFDTNISITAHINGQYTFGEMHHDAFLKIKYRF